jgi:hypothetical protein
MYFYVNFYIFRPSVRLLPVYSKMALSSRFRELWDRSRMLERQKRLSDKQDKIL